MSHSSAFKHHHTSGELLHLEQSPINPAFTHTHIGIYSHQTHTWILEFNVTSLEAISRRTVLSKMAGMLTKA